jgi:hypothetical protein
VHSLCVQNQATKFELLELDPFYDENGWRIARVAIDGIPSIPFQFHKTAVELYPSEDALMGYLCRQGAAVIARYGDSRNPISFDDGRVH